MPNSIAFRVRYSTRELIQVDKAAVDYGASKTLQFDV